ncbi:MAG: UvrD-helicase domain-containing protein [Holosporales bacterium]|jgi:ATP-dependent helicase/nuclease subunit A|nr:UvrD-helicase domain-containing protein [Holosporales bacterium]
MRTNSLQFLAADPYTSTWLSASAGSGKTKVLVDRFLRLLISGEQFSSILCFTYTNAGATEMRQRFQQQLQEMSTSRDLRAVLFSLLQRTPTNDEEERTRSLFAILLRNPKALQIKTIHSFCRDFLQQYDAEFLNDSEILNQADAAKLLTEAQSSYCDDSRSFFDLSLQNAHAEERQAPGAYEYLLSIMTFEQIDETLSALLSKRYDFAQILKTYEPTMFAEMLKKKIGQAIVAGPFDEQITQHIANKIGLPENPTIQAILTKNYEQAFLTTTQTLRKKLTGLTSSELYPALYEQAEKFFTEAQQKNADALIRKTQAFVNVANAIFQKYQQIKEEKGQYDFEDLIMKTGEIFTKASDDCNLKNTISLGTKHIFIDEAQDTTPQQWKIVLHLVTLFFQKDCTLFVVGDAKQSIFSFQGAKPWLFTTLQEVFEKLITAAGGTFQRLELSTSYRSAPEVLNLVDTIFQDDSNFSAYAQHIPARQEHGFARCVTVAEKNAEDSEILSTKDAVVCAVASIVAEFLNHETFCPCVNRNVIPSDILVLARQRRDLCAIAQELVERDIQCEHAQNVVWLDLQAFVTFLVDPTDDYNLACLLKSPFLQNYAVTDEQLLLLCYERTDTLWNEILKNGSEEPDFAKSHVTNECSSKSNLADVCYVKDILEKYRDDAANIKNNDDFYTFFHKTLSQVQPYFAEYYNTSALDAFLDAVLSFLADNMPSLQSFYDFIQKHSPQKTSQEEGVQLKTIHGAKGTQSPIVVLVDKPSTHRDKWIWFEDEYGDPRCVMLMPPAALSCTKHLRERESARLAAEDRRLLYVAITRAQDGFTLVGRNGSAWHESVAHALALSEN